MKIIAMNRFGRTLTDREYGKSIARTLLQEAGFPVIFDFKGVISLGSSCGDEILNAVAEKQNREIQVMNTNQAVKSCLEKVAEDARIKLSLVS